MTWKPFTISDTKFYMAIGFITVAACIFGLAANLATSSWVNTESWCIFGAMGLVLFYVAGNYFAVLTIAERKSAK